MDPSSDDDLATLHYEPAPETPKSALSDPTPFLVDPDRASILPVAPATVAPRYSSRRELGKGGMGVVTLCKDGRIGRDVAMKVLLPKGQNDKRLGARFLREARIQGQLEHPSIVPVYDVGVNDEGATYFTMKCLRGLSLSQILKGLRTGDPTIVATYSRRKLLTAFSSLCLTVEFAHSRGVLHRDLKPSNVMLGDFGEVYLLDWGIAKVLDTPAVAVERPIDVDGANVNMQTMAGKVLGTLGYMSPEQARGLINVLDARSDVYSLGAILFELLTLEPLHPRDNKLEILSSTVLGVESRPSVRAPDRDVPPELDAICAKATKLEQTDRYPSARALHEAIERFLDGDRNMELRRDLSAKHAQAALAAVDEALSGGKDAIEARKRALGEVGKALALDASNSEALALLEKIFTEPPRELPREVVAEMDASAGARHRLQLQEGIKADITGVLIAAGMSLWMGVRDWVVFAAVGLTTLLAAATKLVAVRQCDRAEVVYYGYVAYLFNVLAVIGLGRGYGPLLFMPLLLVMFTYAYSTTYHERFRIALLVTGCVALLGAVGIEVLGLWPRSYSFADGAMTILPRAVVHSRVPTMSSLTVSGLFMMVVPVLMMGRLQRALREAEQRASLQAWQLRQLLPSGTKPASAPGESR